MGVNFNLQNSQLLILAFSLPTEEIFSGTRSKSTCGKSSSSRISFSAVRNAITKATGHVTFSFSFRILLLQEIWSVTVLFDLRKSLVWRKQRGHFERQKQRKRFYHIFLTSSSFVCSVTNWLLRFYPLFFVARSKGKNFRNSSKNCSNCLPRKVVMFIASRKLQLQAGFSLRYLLETLIYMGTKTTCKVNVCSRLDDNFVPFPRLQLSEYFVKFKHFL